MDIGAGVEAKIKLFQNMVMLGWGQKINFLFFSESGQVAYQIKVKEV